MPVIQVSDVQNALPAYTISASSKPSEEQVEAYIADIESEVRALLAGCGGVWPDDDSDAATFLRLTVREGAVWLTLRARFGATRSDQVSDEVQNARDAYNDRKREICKVAAGVRAETPASVGGMAIPFLGAESDMPNLKGDFFGWTAATDRDTGRLTTRGRYGRW